MTALVAIFYFRVFLLISNVPGGAQLAAVANGITIMVFNKLYGYVSVKLNDWENHRTETEYEDHLIAKTFLFQFINSYSSLFYIAFFKNKSFTILGRATECVIGENGQPDCLLDL